VTLRGVITIGIAIALGAAIVVPTILWNDYPGSGPKPTLEYEGEPALGVERPLAIVHYYREPPPYEIAVKIVTSLLVLMAVAAIAAAQTQRRKIAVGAMAAALVAFAVTFALRAIAAPTLQISYFPSLSTLAVNAAIGALLGALAAWAYGRWWPNKSLERTREG
jgi:hypothetical protein